MDDIQSILDNGQKSDNEKKILAEKLIDKDNPEMITFVSVQEVDDISLLQTVGHDIDTQRKVLKLKTSFLTSYLKNNMVIRTSLHGTRSIQLVNTINSVTNEEILQGSSGLSFGGKKTLGL